ncbi:hypothetical protein EVAR_80869_1 [Eumeta japonica]|uniref:Uncharacterized protein n=1 Tax=Eumeta variegata TaxID=151549 RepID=A0A4C1V026_EUMVA|nr:hypothetical protein EVAR_80869_1 [Eumeta japonica]
MTLTRVITKCNQSRARPRGSGVRGVRGVRRRAIAYRGLHRRLSASAAIPAQVAAGSHFESVTLGNVTMSHRTREARRMPCVSPTQL